MIIPKTLVYYVIRRIIWYYHNFRVHDWRAYLSMAVLGFIFGLNKSFLLCINYNFLVKFIISTILYLAFTFCINNCFDIECDSRQASKLRKNPIAAGLISFREALVLSFSVACVGLALTYMFFNGLSFFLYTVVIFLSAAYSTPPIRFKTIPIIDLISHGLFFGLLLFLYGVSVTGGFSLEVLIVGFSIFSCSIILELRNHLRDLDADIQSGIRTTVCWLGSVKTKKFLKILFLLHQFLLILVLWAAGFRSAFFFYISGMLFILFLISLRLKLNNATKVVDLSSILVYTVASLPHLMNLFPLSG